MMQLSSPCTHQGDKVSLLYGLQEQGEADLLPTWRLHRHRCQINQLADAVVCTKSVLCTLVSYASLMKLCSSECCSLTLKDNRKKSLRRHAS